MRDRPDLKALEEGASELLRWFNSLLHSSVLPANWHKSVMIFLPTKPTVAEETRPVAISSAAERLFSRMILERCKERLRLEFPWQYAGPHRQAADYLHALYKLAENERELGRRFFPVLVG